LVENGVAVTNVFFRSEKKPPDTKEHSTPLLRRVARQIEEYLNGKRTEFDLPLKPEGTEFQRAVWKALQTIPYGETRSYRDIAEQIGSPKACRAVGMANHRNPITIIIPCHRVIGTDGSLTGYGGGLKLKQQLLDLEKQ
jgi:methylated-DNA-[protein]-cysteine S-methyltransferase